MHMLIIIYAVIAALFFFYILGCGLAKHGNAPILGLIIAALFGSAVWPAIIFAGLVSMDGK